jgi:hypothetical protein
MATICGDFVRRCRRDDDALDKLVKAGMLLREEAVHVKSARMDSEWALRLWSALSRLHARVSEDYVVRVDRALRHVEGCAPR